MENKQIKEVVKNTYARIAGQEITLNTSSCQCCADTKKEELIQMTDSYQDLDGYLPEADLGLGCGLPTEYAAIQPGDSVLDLGSGAGNDVFIAAKLAGPSGWVTGIDMTPEMILRAERNAKKHAFENVIFKLADIENLPVADDTIDVVISNCVINLTADKKKAFKEIYRVLKKGAHFCISDIVSRGQLPETLKKSAELYTGCLAGALDEEALRTMLLELGFENITIHKEIRSSVDEELLRRYLDDRELEAFRKSRAGFYSLTFSACK